MVRQFLQPAAASEPGGPGQRLGSVRVWLPSDDLRAWDRAAANSAAGSAVAAAGLGGSAGAGGGVVRKPAGSDLAGSMP